MLLNGGELNGVRLLSPKTVELMTASHTSDLPSGAVSIGGPGSAFGLGVRVLTDLGASQLLGSTGLFGWSGIYGTTFWIDPKEELIGILMVQRYPSAGALQQIFQAMTYQAIVGPARRSPGAITSSDARR
jgi:CubicO group peptidase (beta-lactamase class C family)